MANDLHDKLVATADEYIKSEEKTIIEFVDILDELYRTVDTLRFKEKYLRAREMYLSRLDTLKKIRETGEC